MEQAQALHCAICCIEISHERGVGSYGVVRRQHAGNMRMWDGVDEVERWIRWVGQFGWFGQVVACQGYMAGELM